MPNPLSISSGRRGYLRYLYGTHYFAPDTQANWVRGIIRDTARQAIPAGGLYDAVDFLTHEPGRAFKRGGTAYVGPRLAGPSYIAAVAQPEFPSGAQNIQIADTGLFAKVTGTAANSLGNPGTQYATADTPKFRAGGTDLLIVCANDGVSPPQKYDGSSRAVLGAHVAISGSTSLPAGTVTAASDVSTAGFPPSGTFWVASTTGAQQITYTGTSGSTFTGCTGGTGTAADGTIISTVPPGKYAAVYKTRLALAGVKGVENRVFFSPTPDVENVVDGAGWDTADSYIDVDHPVTGMAALANTLLVFSATHTERIIGSTPPPGSDMDRQPVGEMGCTDARSITVTNGLCVFANPKGVYTTGGVGYDSLTADGGIESYWRSLFTGYDPASWTIAAGVLQTNFLVVSVTDNTGALVDALLCYLPRKAWTRLGNVQAAMFAQASDVELYYADRATPGAVAMSGILSPGPGNTADANGAAVEPSLELLAVGSGGTTEQRFGHGRVTYDMRGVNPKLAVTVKTGIEADVSFAPDESPLAATTTVERARFEICRESQAVTVRFDQQGASTTTDLFTVEIERRGQPYAELDSPA